MPGQAAASGAAPRDPSAAQAGQLRPRQDAVQHRRLGGMKMLNALEKAPRPTPQPRAKASPSCCACCRRSRRTSPRAVARTGLRRRHPRRALARAARRSAGAGRNRTGAAGQRQAARQHPRTGRRRPGGDRSSGAGLRSCAQKYMEGKPAKKVVVVPGRLVNIVVVKPMRPLLVLATLSALRLRLPVARRATRCPSTRSTSLCRKSANCAPCIKRNIEASTADPRRR